MNRFTDYYKPINIHVRDKEVIDGTINKKDPEKFNIPQGIPYDRFNQNGGNPSIPSDFIISQNSPDLVYNNKYYTRISLKSFLDKLDKDNPNRPSFDRVQLNDRADYQKWKVLDKIKQDDGGNDIIPTPNKDQSLVIKSLSLNSKTFERELVVDLLRFKDIHDKPTTLEGYGIEDAASKTDLEKLQTRFDGSFVFKKRIATNSELDDISKKKPKEGEETKDLGPQKGDVYRVEEEKRNYYWDGSEWVPFCGTDSLYWFGTVWPEPNFEQREIKWGGPGFKEKKQ